jgi:hypothetical protein
VQQINRCLRALRRGTQSTRLQHSLKSKVVAVVGVAVLCTSAVLFGHLDHQRRAVPVVTLAKLSHVRHWSERVTPAGVNVALIGVSCGNEKHCVAIGASQGSLTQSGVIIESSDGGATWSHLKTQQGITFTGVSCFDALHCMVVGTEVEDQYSLVEVTSDGGVEWTLHALSSGISWLGSLVCLSQTHCLAGGANGLTPLLARTSDDAKTWNLVSLPTSVSSINALVCPTASYCLAGGSGPGPEASSPSVVLASKDQGVSWSLLASIAQPSGMGQISCLNATRCVGDIFSGATTSAGLGSALWTNDGGKSWRKSAAIGSSVSCAQTLCLSVGGSNHATTSMTQSAYHPSAYLSLSKGKRWQKVKAPNFSGLFEAATCPTSRCCVVVGARTSADGTQPGVIFTYAARSKHPAA